MLAVACSRWRRGRLRRARRAEARHRHARRAGAAADFEHLPYANPDAPKGGRITYGNVGTFDSLNPFIVQGTAPRGLWDETLGHNVWESLLTRNRDEPFTLYGLLAEIVEMPDDRSWVEFTLRPGGALRRRRAGEAART